jgi:transposase
VKKRIYKKVLVNQFVPGTIKAAAHSQRLVLAIDVAKVDMVAALTDESAQVLTTIAWKHPAENSLLFEKLRALGRLGFDLEAVMESSGTYGDVLRHQLIAQGIAVFRVSGKRTHDAREVYDGVPSLHDAKSAAIIAKLHLDRASSPWLPMSEDKRRLKAAIALMDDHRESHQRIIHQLESWLARYWPELTTLLELGSATLLAVLARLGGPGDVAREPDKARKLLLGMSHRLMKVDKVEAVLASAQHSVGLEMLNEERATLMALAAEAHRALRAFKAAKHRVEELSEGTIAATLAPVVGKATAAVLLSELGDPRDYAAARAYVKAFGLNLKEKSSGKFQGKLKLTKRGSGRARQWLWLATHRWRSKDRFAEAWHQSKVRRDGGFRSKATIALMRKLAKALYHVARGAAFDSHLLFDTKRLQPFLNATP